MGGTIDSFIYKWTDHLTGMFYIGVHKGTINDGYICSSKIMLPIYLERPETFTREILSYWNDYTLAREEEIRLLTEVDSARNPLYYNRSNGGAKGFHCNGYKHSEETIQKMSGKIPHNKGISPSFEIRQKMSDSQKGKPKSEEHIKNVKESLKGRIPWNKGKTGCYSEEILKKMIENRKKVKT